MSDGKFEQLWSHIQARCDRLAFPMVQDKRELKYIHDLMVECRCASYLEIGSAEGNSLYVLGDTVSEHIDYIDLGEDHTLAKRQEVVDELVKNGKKVTGYLGNSTHTQTLFNVSANKYDCVFIDGGHDYDTVLSDAIMYARLATKYVFFHDVQLPEVSKAIATFLKTDNLGRYYTFINSTGFGYGIIEVGK